MLDRAKKLGWGILTSKEFGFEQCRQQMRGFYSRSRAVNDLEMQEHVKTLPRIGEIIYRDDIISEFQNSFAYWIRKNTLNTCKGLEHLEPDLSQGATQAFESFYLRHRGRKLKLFAGEYLYHLVVARDLGIPCSFINDADDIMVNDCVVLSVPFCDTGDTPNNLEVLLEKCDGLGVPVLLDCAYYTISKGIHIDLNHDCIDTVTFSLSKTFPIAHARVGMRFIRPGIADGQKLHSKINYDNRLSAGVGLHFIHKFSSDHVYLKHCDFYTEIIKFLGLKSSQTIIFADGSDEWQQYGRRDILNAYGLEQDQSMYRNRVCVTELLENAATARSIMNEHNRS